MSPGAGELLDGLPATLDALLAHPERHRPAVVERLLELTDALRRSKPQEALALADAAQRLAAKIPAFFPRAERFRLRARSFEVWGSLKRQLGDELSAEGGFMAAFELLTQTDPQQSEALAAVLGRHALLAGDRRHQPGVARYVEAGVEIAQALDGGQPLAAIRPMIEAVMEEEDAVLPTMLVVLSLVANTATVPESAGGDAVGELTTELDFGETVDSKGHRRDVFEVYLRREASANGGLPWKVSVLIKLFNQQECDVILIRQVPSASEPGEWTIEDRIGWKVFSSEEEARAADKVEG